MITDVFSLKERKQAILRRTAEREAKLEHAKSKKMCASGICWVCYSIHNHCLLIGFIVIS